MKIELLAPGGRAPRSATFSRPDRVQCWAEGTPPARCLHLPMGPPTGLQIDNADRLLCKEMPLPRFR